MAKCDFCGKEIPFGTGKIYVKKEGKKINLCSNKCEKNLLKLRRKPWEIKWTESFRQKKGITK